MLQDDFGGGLMGDPEWEDPYLTGEDYYYPGMIPDEGFGFEDSTDVLGSYPGLDASNPVEDYPYNDPADDQFGQSGDYGGNWYDPLVNFGKNIVGDDKSSPRSDALRGAGISALGELLKSLFAKPLFQERQGFTGAANPQKMMEQGIGGLSQLQTQLQSRISQGFPGFEGVVAQNPMSGMATDPGMGGGPTSMEFGLPQGGFNPAAPPPSGEDEVKSVLESLRSGGPRQRNL